MLSMEEINKFVKYWWFRYLMITEMYMVEQWEVIVIHTLFAIVFTGFWYINYSVVLGLIGSVVDKPAVLHDFLHSAPALHHTHGSATYA